MTKETTVVNFISPFMSVDECATYLNIHPMTVYRLCKAGKLPSLKLGGNGNLRISKKRLDEMTDKGFSG